MSVVVDYIRAPFSPADQERLAELVAAKLTATQICEAMDKPHPTITAWCQRLGLEPRKMTPEEIAERAAECRVRLVQPRHRIPLRRNPLQEASTYLGKRLMEKNGQYYLDGVPTNLDRIVRATNQVLKDRDIPQMDANPAWVVP